MVFSYYSSDSIICISKDRVELIKIGKDKTGASSYDTVYIKDTNSVAVSSWYGGNRCIAIIDIESRKVTTTISINTNNYGMAVRGRGVLYHVNHNMSRYVYHSLCNKVYL
jgi:hypothetical protein